MRSTLRTPPRIVFCPRCDSMVAVTGTGTADDPLVLPEHTVTLGGIACLVEPTPARALINTDASGNGQEAGEVAAS